MGRATGIHKGQHLLYLENHKFLVDKEILPSKEDREEDSRPKRPNIEERMNEDAWQSQRTGKRIAPNTRNNGFKRGLNLSKVLCS